MLSAAPFHTSVNKWFGDHFAAPTEVQVRSWPLIAQGRHVLITAPTGSGKTLTAFLWSLSQFATGTYETGRTQVLYISPLKALNNDIQRNLLQPLRELQEHYGYPNVRVHTRSGDTPQSDRQRMLRKPPDILVTTPESLNLLLTTVKGRQALSHVSTVIIDEIHALADNRRGAHLMTSLERLADIAGEFQRIALSATVSPLDAIAHYVGGRDAAGHLRRMDIVNPTIEKKLQFRVRFPEAARHAAENGQKIWEPLANDFRDIIASNHSTLFFTNSRRLAEKITLKINDASLQPVAYAHHGSLSREIRTEVEQRLKDGSLKAIVSTNSLEMGIDIGHLDEVVMVQSPPSVTSALQRIGRAGHQVGETSRGTLYPTHAHDFLEAAVLHDAVAARDIEPIQPMRGALDVIAQVIISICATDARPVDYVYQLIKRASPYHNLSRTHFDLVVDMLAGRYGGTRIRELKPRLTFDRIAGTLQANRGAVLAMYNSGGSIPDRGYYKMRHLDTGNILGELDEEFVWEATIGQTFTLGTQHWQVQRITHNDVMVRAAKAGQSAPPFWRSESYNRSYHFSERIGRYLETTDEQLARGEATTLIETLQRDRHFEAPAAEELVSFLSRQRQHTETSLPHRHHLLLELVRTGPGGYHGPDEPRQLVIHTYWGGRLNRPWALALRAAWRNRFGIALDIHTDNNALVLQCKAELNPHDIMTLVTPQSLGDLLRQSLEQSGFFGARFRECAGRALLLSKQRFDRRLPLWMSRLQAKKLMHQVKRFDDFPVMLESWRTCLDDEFDLPNLIARLQEIEAGDIRWTYVTTASPSPFASHLTFNQINRYMYADDTPDDDELSKLSSDLISTALHNPALRPRLEPDVVDVFVRKRQRRFPGYEPTTQHEWSEWLKERILIPDDEVAETDLCETPGVWLTRDRRRWLTHPELVHGLIEAGFFGADTHQSAARIEESRTPLQLAREILSFYGPLSDHDIARILPLVPAGTLQADESFVRGELLKDDDAEYGCDAENFEILMRFQRASRRANFLARPQTELPGFWSALHRLPANDVPANLLWALECLRSYPAPVQTWLFDLLGARIPGFTPDRWDDLLHQHGMGWRGCSREQISVGYAEDLALLGKQAIDDPVVRAFADVRASYTFAQLAENGGNSQAAFNADFWASVWRGCVTCDSLAGVQRGYERQFVLGHNERPVTSRRRLTRSALGWPGHWRLTTGEVPQDALSVLEADKDRLRLLLDRYGVVNRDLVNREGLPTNDGIWRWQHAFRALRVMELAGEVMSGEFFAGLSTPQFISPQAFSLLRDFTTSPDCFWVAATDPIAPCGLGLDWPQLPHRRLGNYIVFCDGAVALVVSGSGKTLDYHVADDHPRLDEINGVLSHLANVRRLRVSIETINGAPAKASAYLPALRRLMQTAEDHRTVFLEAVY